jgi:hypothetical protein
MEIPILEEMHHDGELSKMSSMGYRSPLSRPFACKWKKQCLYQKKPTIRERKRQSGERLVKRENIVTPCWHRNPCHWASRFQNPS